jgi:ClpP class serine protease
MQAMVDGLNDHFVAYAAQMRDMDPDAVRALDAGVLTGQAAIDAGLVNSIMSFQDTLAAFETKVSGGARLTNGGFRQLPPGGTTMSKDAQSAAVETPTAEQVAAQVAAAQASGAAQMQARIKDIQTCDEAKGRSKLAAHLAFNTAMGLDDAKALLAASAVEVAEAAGQASALAAGMAQLSNPAVGSEAAAASDPNPQAEAAAVWIRSNAKLRAVK